ncbi:MAG: hypothetical protein AB1806_04560 [Acidobacteriota bacterium]
MTTPRAALLTVSVMMIAAWAVLAAGSRAGQRTVDLVRTESGPGGGHDRRMLGDLRPLAAAHPLRIRRDPFRFRQSAPHQPLPALARVALQALASSPSVPDGPLVRLVGIAETRNGGATVRTAVISVDGEVVLAGEGALIGGRYRVARVEYDAVHLEGPGGDSPRILRLR